MTLAPGASAEPLVLRAGQRLLAEVLAADATTFRAVLSLAGRRLETQLPPGMPPLQPGQLVRVTVAEASAERLVLRIDAAPVGEGGAPPPAASIAQGLSAAPVRAAGIATVGGELASAAATAGTLDPGAVLSQLDLPDTPPLRAAVTALLERGQPLQREALVAIRSAIAGQPGAVEENARAAVLLRQAGIPLTARSLELARTALTTQTSLGPLLGELLSALDDQLPPSPGETLPPTAAPPDADPSLPAEAAAPGGAIVARGLAPRTLTATTDSATPSAAGGSPTARPGEAPLPSQLSGSPSTPQLPASPQPAGSAGASPAPSPPLPTLSAAPPPAAPLSSPPEGTASIATPPPASPAPSLATLRQTLSDLAVHTLDPQSLARVVDQLARPSESVLARILSAGTAITPETPEPASDARAALRPLLDQAPDDFEPPAEDAVRRLPSTVDATAGPPPSLPAAVRLLAQELHDRIELQQLRSAAAQSQAGAPALRPEVGDAAAPGAPAAPQPQPALPLMLSIPLAVAGQYATLELHVQSDRDSRRDPGEPGAAGVRATFSIELQRLGTVAADLRLSGATLRCRLRARTEAGMGVLAAATDGLRTRLETAGFHVESLACERLEDPAQPRLPDLHHVSLRA